MDVKNYVIESLRVSKRARLRGQLVPRPSARRHAFVICGGPSYTPEVAECLKQVRDSVDVYALNWYCENASAREIVPDFYVLSDPAHLSPPPELEARAERLFDYLTSNDIKVVVPEGRRWVRRVKGLRAFHFNDTEAMVFGNYRLDLPRGYRSNTSFKAIAFALNVGYDRIVVSGLDYNYPNKIFLKEGRLHLRDEHHYGVKESDYSIYFEGVGHALNWWSLDYLSMQCLASTSIVNISEGSLADAFQLAPVSAFLDGSVWGKMAPSDIRLM